MPHFWTWREAFFGKLHSTGSYTLQNLPGKCLLLLIPFKLGIVVIAEKQFYSSFILNVFPRNLSQGKFVNKRGGWALEWSGASVIFLKYLLQATLSHPCPVHYLKLKKKIIKLERIYAKTFFLEPFPLDERVTAMKI